MFGPLSVLGQIQEFLLSQIFRENKLTLLRSGWRQNSENQDPKEVVATTTTQVAYTKLIWLESWMTSVIKFALSSSTQTPGAVESSSSDSIFSWSLCATAYAVLFFVTSAASLSTQSTSTYLLKFLLGVSPITVLGICENHSKVFLRYVLRDIRTCRTGLDQWFL